MTPKPNPEPPAAMKLRHESCVNHWASLCAECQDAVRLAALSHSQGDGAQSTPEELADIQSGLADIAAGRTKPVDQVRAEIDAKLCRRNEDAAKRAEEAEAALRHSQGDGAKQDFFRKHNPRIDAAEQFHEDVEYIHAAHIEGGIQVACREVFERREKAAFSRGMTSRVTEGEQLREARRLALEEAKNVVAYFFDTHKGEVLKSEPICRTILGRLDALDWSAEKPEPTEERVLEAAIAWQRERHGLRHGMKPDEVELNDAAHDLDIKRLRERRAPTAKETK